MQILTLIEHLAPGLTGAAGLSLQVRLPLLTLTGHLRRRAQASLERWSQYRLKPALAPDAPPDASLSAIKMWEERLGEGAAEGVAGFGLPAVRRRSVAVRGKNGQRWKSVRLPRGRSELLDLVLETLTQDPAVTWPERVNEPKNLRWRVDSDRRFHVNENLMVDRLAGLLRKRGTVRPLTDTRFPVEAAIVDSEAQDALEALAAAEATAALRELQDSCCQEGPAAHAAWQRAVASMVGESPPSRRALAAETSPPTTVAAIRHAEKLLRPRLERLIRRLG